MLIALGAVLILIVAGTEPASAKHTVGSWESSQRPSEGGVRPGGHPSSNGHGGGHGASAIQEVSSTATASGNASTASATATCPGGIKAAGGGFDAPSSDGAVPLVYESVKVGNKAWRASAQLLSRAIPPRSR